MTVPTTLMTTFHILAFFSHLYCFIDYWFSQKMILSVHLSIYSGNINFSLIFVSSNSGIALTIHGSATIHGSISTQYNGANVSDVIIVFHFIFQGLLQN